MFRYSSNTRYCVCSLVIFYCSSYSLIIVGDLPVATARWRLYQNDQTLWILQIDRLVTTNHNQRRGFAYRCLHKILAVAATFPTGFNCIEIIVPQIHESAWVLMKLQSLGFAVSDHVVPSWLGVAAHTATLHLGGIDAQRSELDRIQSFLLQKTAVLVR